jgi:hypothetical protein
VRLLTKWRPSNRLDWMVLMLVLSKKNWSIVGKEVCEAVLLSLNSGIMNKDLNSIYTVLIPKTKDPKNVRDFRPISFCNVLYKLISKVLANRLKRVLPYIISPFQSAFIPE